jgi:DNA-binding response OmpR family regulator
MTLTQAGFAVEEVGDGIAALEFLRTRRPDLVMLDVTMPGIDGFTTCARIREMDGRASSVASW